MPLKGQRSGAIVIDMAGTRVKFDPPVGGFFDSTDVAVVDWDVLFNAVTARLQQIVGSSRPSELLPNDDSGQVRTQVLQCVSALEQLHTSMRHYIERGRALEQDLASAHSTLADVRADLAGTQASERAARHLAAHDSLTSLPNGTASASA
ncbi:MAG: hypothetical protein V4792_09375 [Pseudomonadota bacterium]